MKTLYILLFLFLGTSAVAIAQDTTDVVDQIVFYRADSTAERYSYHHTWSKDLTTLQLVETFKNGQWENNRRYNYDADSNKFVIKTSKENWIEDQWVLEWYQTYFYDTKWNLMISVYEEWDKGKLIRSNKAIYDNTYDTKGNKWIMIIQDLRNGEYVNSERTTRTFDTESHLLINLEEYWSGGQWVASNKETYTYDQNGNKLTDKVDFWEKGELVYTSVSTQTYDSNNKVLTFLYEGIENGIITKSYRYTYTYDLKGNELTKLYEDFKNGIWNLIHRETRTYNNKELTYLSESWKDGVWNFLEKETHVYAINGNTLSYLYEKWEAGVLTYSKRHTYSYDSDGKVLIDLCELLKENKWVNSSRNTYEYASNGKNNLHIYEYWNNDQWVRGEFYSADIDNKGNITSDTTYDNVDGYFSGKYTYDNFGNILTSNKVQTKNGKLYKKHRINYTYNTNGHLLTFQNEEYVADEWSNVDVWFSFEDSKTNWFGSTAYRFEVTYETKTPVKEKPTLSGFSLNCSPNPTSGQLNINYTLTEPANTSISISNILGIEVANINENQVQIPGMYNLNYDASNFTPGVYFVTVKAGNKSETKKIVIND